MTEQDAFLAAIRESPDEDAPRLMYADWLTEQGDPRGEFNRGKPGLAAPPTSAGLAFVAGE